MELDELKKYYPINLDNLSAFLEQARSDVYDMTTDAYPTFDFYSWQSYMIGRLMEAEQYIELLKMANAPKPGDEQS